MTQEKKEIREFGEFATRWAVAIIVLFTVIFFSQQCRAEYFIDMGQSQYQKPANGLWWQDGYSHQDNFKSLYIRGGKIFPTFKYFSVSGSAYSLGRYKQEADAVQDHLYTPAALIPADERFTVSGAIYGVALTGIVHTSDKRFFVEGGYTYQRQSFKLFYKDHTQEIGYQESIWGAGKMMSIGMNYKSWRGAVSVYSNGDSDKFNQGHYPSGVDKVYVFSVGKTF